MSAEGGILAWFVAVMWSLCWPAMVAEAARPQRGLGVVEDPSRRSKVTVSKKKKQSDILATSCSKRRGGS
jgi:hypothetical protein